MIIEMDKEDLVSLVKKQLTNLFIFNEAEEDQTLKDNISIALSRSEHCFSKSSNNKYYKRDLETYFNPFHSGQYCIFLYFLSNSIWRSDPRKNNLADRIYYLNKALNALDLFYEVEMPDVFFLDHPVGSVLGRAKYGKNFCFAQNCTVGNNKGTYPEIGENVKMLANTTILGKCKIGNNVIISANTYIKDSDIPNNCIVFGSSPNLTIKLRDESYFNHLT